MGNKSSNRRYQPELAPVDFELVDIPILPAHMDRAQMDRIEITNYYGEDAIFEWLKAWDIYYSGQGADRDFVKTVELPLI